MVRYTTGEKTEACKKRGLTTLNFAHFPMDSSRRRSRRSSQNPRPSARDVATGAMTTGDKWARTPEDILVISRWSPDGKRVAHAVREKNAKEEESVRIVVCDPDGGNEVKLSATRAQFMGDISWLPSRHKIAAPQPK